ncbi:MAG: hypothetical protein WCG80_09955 [Spirochaetales bacterium]
MRFRALVATLLLMAATLVAQAPSVAPWPGLRLRDALEALRVIRLAGVVSHLEADKTLKPVFLKADREIAMKYLRGDETMWFALVLRGVEIDPREWWLTWEGRLVNLGQLFTYGEEFDPSLLNTTTDG